MTVKQVVSVWGFPSEALHGWPEDLEPQPVIRLPTDKLLFVHSNKAETFQEQVEEELHAKGDLQDAVLYLTDEGLEPEDAWMYFETTVKAKDWDAIRELVACTQQIAMANWAEEVPFSQIDQILNSQNFVNPALPSKVSQHLSTCESCHRAFTQTLSERQLWHYQLVCPPVERLAAVSWNQVDDAWVTAHKGSCSACRAEIATLERLLVPVPVPKPVEEKPSLIEIMGFKLQTLREELRAEIQKWTGRLTPSYGGMREALASMFVSLNTANMRLAATPVTMSGLMRGGAPDVGSARTPSLPTESMVVKEFGSSVSSKLFDPSPKIKHITVDDNDLNFDFVLGWSEEDEVVWIEGLHGEDGEEFEYFELEIQDFGATPWRIKSREGRAVIGLAELEAALKNEATLVIRAQKPDHEVYPDNRRDEEE